MPDKHVWHDLAPSPAYSPTEQLVHALAPSSAENVSLPQLVQLEDPALLAYVPAWQVWHSPDRFPAENSPAWHCRHMYIPAVHVYRPGPHAVHAVAPKNWLYAPNTHSVQ